jgi:hypothetical protein
LAHSAFPQGTLNGWNDRIDGLALGAAIGMIDAVALIVAVDEPGPDKIGDRAADIGAPRIQKALANLVGNALFGRGGVRRQHALTLKIAADLIDNSPTADIALRFSCT